VWAFGIVGNQLEAIANKPKRRLARFKRSIVEAQVLGCGDTSNMAHKLFRGDIQVHILLHNGKMRLRPATGEY
jgi:hypothetical protein